MSTTPSFDRLLPCPTPRGRSRQLLLYCVRRMAAAGLHDALATQALMMAFGIRFRRPLILLRALVAELSRVSSRRILIAPCCCPRMTEAEAVILSAIEVAIDDPRQAHRSLVTLLGVADCLGALSSAQAVHQSFADLGQPLER